ncbi:unnamed protein product [Dibothriocephalus latus]|uniref:UBP34/UBP24/USP9X/USP9Y-like ARM repeat region domain-containing protein n=1 Tax=Dibothriocephalus latus TaxID=60516 RepID=A0A3P7LEN0_DIBLA|nr:unnamed protein product [Dibothriocephalus latus]
MCDQNHGRRIWGKAERRVNLDNETYMSKICELLRCLRERITLEDITVLWKCQEGQSAAAVTNILQLLADVGANCFNQSQLDHLFNLIRGVIYSVLF